jgi:hypothetical protein
MKHFIFEISDYDVECLDKLKNLEEIKKHFSSEKITRVGIMRLALSELFTKYKITTGV